MSGEALLAGDGNGNGGQGEGGIRGLTAIPSNMKKTIQNIREITGKQHSDDDIYAVLKECSMDPNETAQKLLYLGMYAYKFAIFFGVFCLCIPTLGVLWFWVFVILVHLGFCVCVFLWWGWVFFWDIWGFW